MTQSVENSTSFPTARINDWIFDLDNTIYPANTNLFLRVAVRITDFVANHYLVPHEEARVIQKDLFHRYGTTMRGMMTEEAICPDSFLNFVHDIDLSDLPCDQELDQMIGALPGKKHIFTNGTVPHAENVLNTFGIRHHFDHIFDIVAADYIPKPEQYAFDQFMKKTGIDPTGAAMIEDMACNLQPAAELGMCTVWLDSDIEWAARGAGSDYVHYRAVDLKGFLAAVAE